MERQEKQFKKRLFVDMDGVLAEWRTGELPHTVKVCGFC